MLAYFFFNYSKKTTTWNILIAFWLMFKHYFYNFLCFAIRGVSSSVDKKSLQSIIKRTIYIGLNESASMPHRKKMVWICFVVKRLNVQIHALSYDFKKSYFIIKCQKCHISPHLPGKKYICSDYKKYYILHNFLS